MPSGAAAPYLLPDFFGRWRHFFFTKRENMRRELHNCAASKTPQAAVHPLHFPN